MTLAIMRAMDVKRLHAPSTAVICVSSSIKVLSMPACCMGAHARMLLEIVSAEKQGTPPSDVAHGPSQCPGAVGGPLMVTCEDQAALLVGLERREGEAREHV